MRVSSWRMQVDNPCAVLDQENSKKFLLGSEGDKYAFFMKATDLDRIHAVRGVLGRSVFCAYISAAVIVIGWVFGLVH